MSATAEIRIKPKQGRIIKDDSRFMVAVCGRRFGKTTTLLLKMFLAACKRKGMYGYFAPTHKQAKLIAWNMLKDIVPDHYQAGKPNESELFIPLKNGSEIRLFGMKEAEGNLGIKLAGAIVDEYDQMDKRQVDDVLRPALADMQGFLWYSGTPDATRGQMKELFDMVRLEKKEGKRMNWNTFHFTSLEGGYIPAEEIELARQELDERTFRQNFLASFESLEGKVYYAFDFDENVQQTSVYKPGLPVVMFWDFNVDPFCTAFAQIHTKIGADRKPYQDIQVFDELVIRNSNTEEMCRETLKRDWMKNHTAGFRVYGDAAGRARHTNSSWSDYQIIQNHLSGINRFELRVKDANPHVKDRLNSVNSKLKAMDGKRHIFINPKCKWLIKDLMNVQRKPGTNDLDKTNPELTHSSDALGYFIDYEFPLLKGFLQ
jgi:hypothetical protein